MKITHLDTGRTFDLPVDASLEIERTNLLFNDYGELSFPIDLPDTPNNRELCGYPYQLQQSSKPMQKVSCTILAGGAFYSATMAVLESRRRDKISVCFYVNDGSFLAQIQNVEMKDIIGDDTVRGVSTLTSAIDFCRYLWRGTDNDFAIGTIAVNTGKKVPSVRDSNVQLPFYQPINLYGYMTQEEYTTENMSPDDPPQWYDRFAIGTSPDGTPSDFWNATTRIEKIENEEITYTPGYNIAPFMRAGAALEYVLGKFGYTIPDNPFAHGALRYLTLLHPVADCIVEGKIYYADLLPNVKVTEFLEAYRKKFGCEFVVDESMKTVRVLWIRDNFTQTTIRTITHNVINEPTVTPPEAYQQIRLKSAHVVTDEDSKDKVESFSAMVSNYPEMYHNPLTGEYFRNGFQWYVYEYQATHVPGVHCREIHDRIADSSLPFYEGTAGLPAYDIECPDKMCIIRPLYAEDALLAPLAMYQKLMDVVLVGEPIYRHSKMKEVAHGGFKSSEEVNDEEKDKVYPMFAYCLPCTRSGASPYYVATLSNLVDRGGTTALVADHSLYYNGLDGLYETYYRAYDNAKRNSMLKVDMDVLMSAKELQHFSVHTPKSYNGQPLLVDRLVYKLSDKQEPSQLHCLTMRSYEPVSVAPSRTIPVDFEKESPYKWAIHISMQRIDAAEFSRTPYKDQNFEPYFPPKPTAQLVGTTCYQKQLALQESANVYQMYTMYLQCEQV